MRSGPSCSAVSPGSIVPHIRRLCGPRGGDAAFVSGLLGLIVAVVLLTGLHVEPGRTLANPVERTAESVERGAALFAANCASCHGETGAGDGPLADSLPAPPANFTVHVPFHPDGVLFAWITDGIRGTGMPSWSPQLSDQERWQLVNFLRASFDPRGRAMSRCVDSICSWRPRRCHAVTVCCRTAGQDASDMRINRRTTSVSLIR